MKALLVTYDLKAPGRDYSSLHEAIKTSITWWHYLESTWIIITNETPKQVSDRLKTKIDTNDRLLIIEITDATVSGWLPRKGWDWLRAQGMKW